MSLEHEVIIISDNDCKGEGDSVIVSDNDESDAVGCELDASLGSSDPAEFVRDPTDCLFDAYSSPVNSRLLTER